MFGIQKDGLNTSSGLVLILRGLIRRTLQFMENSANISLACYHNPVPWYSWIQVAWNTSAPLDNDYFKRLHFSSHHISRASVCVQCKNSLFSKL